MVYVAASVEEQSATPLEISSNIAQVSQGVQEVSKNVNESSMALSNVSDDLVTTASIADNGLKNADLLLNQAKGLTVIGSNLMKILTKFKIR